MKEGMANMAWRLHQLADGVFHVALYRTKYRWQQMALVKLSGGIDRCAFRLMPR